MPYPKVPDWWVGPEKPRPIPKNKDVIANYLCAGCLRPPDSCKCQWYPPRSLVWIDRKITDIVTMLNDKGYKTCGCCEGHHGWVYICFNKDYKFDKIPLPEGYGYHNPKRCLLAYTMPENEDYYIQKLREWVKELPKYSEKKFRAGEMW